MRFRKLSYNIYEDFLISQPSATDCEEFFEFCEVVAVDSSDRIEVTYFSFLHSYLVWPGFLQ